MDTTMLIKRGLVWGLSTVVGFALAMVIVYVVLGTDIDTYSVKYFILTALPLGVIALIWGDLLLGTKILPD
jgi:multidrug efflux pump subunit AcrB